MGLLPLLLVLAGCVTRPPAGFVPTPAADPAGIAGRYCYRDAITNVKVQQPDSALPRWILKNRPEYALDRRYHGFTVIPLRRVAERSIVTVDTAAGHITLRFDDRWTTAGTVVRHPVDERRGLLRGTVAVRAPVPPGGGAVLGAGKSRRWAELTRTTGGGLLLVEHYTERGLGLLIVPFTDHLSWVLELEPAASCER